MVLQGEPLREGGLKRDDRGARNAISPLGSEVQLRLRMGRTSGRNFRMPTQLEMENLVVGSMAAVQDVNYWTFWKVWPPPKCVKEQWTA
jgi:hypothetical protein